MVLVVDVVVVARIIRLIITIQIDEGTVFKSMVFEKTPPLAL